MNDYLIDYEVLANFIDKLIAEKYPNQSTAELKTLREDSTWPDTIGSVKDDIEQASSIRPATITFAYYSSEGGEVFKVTE